MKDEENKETHQISYEDNTGLLSEEGTTCLPSANSPYNIFYIIQITLIIAMGGFIFGYDTGIIGGASLYFINDFPTISSGEIETIVSLAIIGAGIGCLIMGPISDSFGRKISMIIGDVLFALGALLMYLATDIQMLMGGRFVAGLGIGSASIVVPIYLSEASFTSIRGRIVTFHQIFVATGQFIAYGVVILCGDDWRLMLGLSGVPAVLQLILMICFPESPKWLIKMEKTQQAETIFKKIFNANNPKGQEEMKQEIDMINEELELEDAKESQFAKYRELFAIYKKIILIGVMAQIWQQLSGINTIMYYSPTILDEAGFGSGNDHDFTLYVSLILAGCLTIGCYVSIAFIDRMGRRYVMLRTLPGMGVCMCLGGLSIKLIANGQSDIGKWLLVAALFVYLALYAIGMGATPNIINAEIYPIHLRGIGNSLSWLGCWLSNYLISAVFLTAIDSTTGELLTFIFFGLCCFLAWTFFYCLLPETKGKSVDENVKAIIPNIEEIARTFHAFQDEDKKTNERSVE